MYYRCITKESPPVKCSPQMDKKVATKEFCGAILDKKGVFAKCINQNNDMAKEFFESCKFDVCANEKDNDVLKRMKCMSLEAFAEECEERGVPVKWRSAQLCREFPPHLSLSLSGMLSMRQKDALKTISSCFVISI